MNFKAIIESALFKSKDKELSSKELIKITKLRPIDFESLIEEIMDDYSKLPHGLERGLEIIKEDDKYKLVIKNEYNDFLENSKNKKYFK